MKRVLREVDIVDELAKKTPFYKNNLKDMLRALGEVIIENMGEATLEDRSEIHLTKGVVIGARRVEAREVKDPRNQEVLMAPEKVIPYAKFTQTFRNKINE